LHFHDSSGSHRDSQALLPFSERRDAPHLAMKVVTSRENPFFKQLFKLARSRQQRKATGLTLLDGSHLVDAYFSGVRNYALEGPKKIILNQSRRQDAEITSLLANRRVNEEVIVLADPLFREISSVKMATGIIALIPIPSPETILMRKRERNENLYVLLEAIQDPGNLGSIMRSAAAAAASDIYLSEGCADAWSPKVLRAAMGAHFLVRVHEQADLAEVARTFSGKVVATSLKAEKSLYQTRLTGSVAFVFGNEGAGLTDVLVQSANEHIIIPMPGGTESLNAAAAAAVCFFERVRQLDLAG
jgi:TrmH family RNA methyltransferase